MKQSFTIGLLLLLALLVHRATNAQAVDACQSSSQTHRQETCSVSASRPVQEALERLFQFYANRSCDISFADAAHSSTDKSATSSAAHFNEHHPQHGSPRPSPLCHGARPNRPITYYVYGLRKIVV